MNVLGGIICDCATEAVIDTAVSSPFASLSQLGGAFTFELPGLTNLDSVCTGATTPFCGTVLPSLPSSCDFCQLDPLTRLITLDPTLADVVDTH